MSFGKLAINVSSSNLNTKFYGLGDRYFKTLTNVVDNINQVDTVTGTTETNGSVNSRSIEVVVGLKKKNLKYMDNVVIISRCHCEQTVVVLACLYIGAIVCPLEQDRTYNDYLNFMKILKPKMAFCDLREATVLDRVIQKLNSSCELIVFDKKHSTRSTFSKLLSEGDANFSPVQIIHPQSTVAFILPAHDTCDEYKLACLSHTCIYSQTKNFLQYVRISKKYMSYYKLPFVVEVILMCSSFEKPLTRILPGQFNERSACKFLHDMRVDYAFMNTEDAINFVSDPAVRDYDLSSVKSILVGGRLASGQDMIYMRHQLKNVKFIQFYATSEAGIVALSHNTDYEVSLDRPATVGKPMPGVEIAVLDLDTKTYLPAYSSGEILATGLGIMMGYFKDKVSSSYLVHHHFLRTGDFGKIDSDGWLYVYCRLDELILRDNFLYCPNELEEFIKCHPFIEDVAVIGDNTDLIACITLKENTQLDTENLMKFLEENSVLSDKPNKVIIMGSLPKTSMGRIKKTDLMKQNFATAIEYSESSLNMHRMSE